MDDSVRDEARNDRLNDHEPIDDEIAADDPRVLRHRREGGWLKADPITTVDQPF